MDFDHASTYLDGRLRNLPHRMRLNLLLAVCDRKIAETKPFSFADFGCSTGYLTNLFAERYKFATAVGFEVNENYLKKAQVSWPAVKFSRLNLNVDGQRQKFDFVTCLESLEHIGNYKHAIEILYGSTAKDGTLLLTVPIEVGFIGIMKFLMKITLGYNVKELRDVPWGRLRYFFALLSGKISEWRDPERPEWDTHFGFDWRLIEDHLKSMGVVYNSKTYGTTRFFFVKHP